MKKIAILSSSVRIGRKSHRVALYLKSFLEEKQLAEVTMIDLLTYNFPIFEERLSLMPNPSATTLQFAQEIEAAEGIIIVVPEYNGGYPAGLKNVIDLLYAEWKRKPIAISTVSAGAFAGSQVITSLQFSLWKIGALMVPAMLPIATVEKTLDENGQASEPEPLNKRTLTFVNELIWWMDAKQKMQS